jgi:hypothetical protein
LRGLAYMGIATGRLLLVPPHSGHHPPHGDLDDR